MKIHINDSEDWIIVKKIAKNTYEIESDSITDDGDWITKCTALGITDWRDGAENLDVSGPDSYESDGMQCFGISDKVKYKDVIFDGSIIYAPSIAAIQEAVRHITFSAWCAGDV